MNIYSLATPFIWVVLILESVFAVALLLSGLSYRFRGRRFDTEITKRTNMFLEQLKTTRHLKNKQGVLNSLRSLKRNSRSDHNVVSRIMDYLLNKDLDQSGIETIIRVHISRLEQGAIRLCRFLARTSPLVGLAGTLVGVQHGLGEFAKQAGEPQVVVRSFSTAILTTLYGVSLAILCVSVSRLIWEPKLHRTTVNLLEFSVTAQSHIQRIKQAVQSKNTEDEPKVRSCIRSHKQAKLKRGDN